MSDRGEKITIYIPGGISRRGIKVAEIVNWTGQVLICQRDEFENLQREWRDEIERQGIYILFGWEGAGGKPDIYIAEAENVKIQLRRHIAKSDFWKNVFILTNKDENVNKTHFKYLEARMVGLAREADKVNLEGTSIPQPPSISRSDQSMAERYLEHAITLLDTLGFSYLQASRSRYSSEKTNGVWEGAVRDVNENLTRERIPSKDDYGNTGKNLRKRTRSEYLRINDIMAARAMKAGDIIWFKRTPDQKAILTADGRCMYEGREMSLAEYAKIASRWNGTVSIYNYLIHGPSGKTIGNLRDQLSISPSDAHPRSRSNPNEGNSDLGNTSYNSSRTNLLKIKDMIDAGVMKVGDVVWFKKTPDQKAILISDEICEYKKKEMSLVEYGKIVSGWTAVNIYQYFIHGPSGKTIEYLRDRLIESTSYIRINSTSPDRSQLKDKKSRSTDSLFGIRLYFNIPMSGINASGICSSECFFVLAGSSGPREMKSHFPSWGRKRRERLVARGEIEYRRDQIHFMQDVRFKTPSTAAVVISGASQNGMIVWKDKDGRTLKEIQQGSS